MSAPRPLAPDRRKVLAGLLSRRAPQLTALLVKVDELALTNDDRDVLRDVIIAELCDHGLKPNDEPNEYGLALEALLDDLGHLP